MNLLALLLAGHLIGDWIVQTDWQAANKTSSWWAMWEHLIGYHLALSFCLLLADPPMSPAAYWSLMVISWSTHALLDRRWPVVWLMRHTGSGPFAETTFGVIAVDQALHISILSLLAAVLG